MTEQFIIQVNQHVQNLTSEMGAAASTSTCFIPESDADSPVSACTDIKRRPRYETPSPYTQYDIKMRGILQQEICTGTLYFIVLGLHSPQETDLQA